MTKQIIIALIVALALVGLVSAINGGGDANTADNGAEVVQVVDTEESHEGHDHAEDDDHSHDEDMKTEEEAGSAEEDKGAIASVVDTLKDAVVGDSEESKEVVENAVDAEESENTDEDSEVIDEEEVEAETETVKVDENEDDDEDHGDHDHGDDEHSHEELYEVKIGEAVPRVDMVVKQDNMSGLNLELSLDNFEFNAASAGSEHVDGQGHAHLYINGEKITRIYNTSYHIPAAWLLDGQNQIEVTLNTNDHRTYSYNEKEIGDQVEIVVEK